jgi:hypothetical protein
MVAGRHHDLVNRYIISISLMTTDMFYGRHHDLDNRYIISSSLMTTYMFYGRHHDLVNRYIIYISLMTTEDINYVMINQVMVSTVEHIRGH